MLEALRGCPHNFRDSTTDRCSHCGVPLVWDEAAEAWYPLPAHAGMTLRSVWPKCAICGTGVHVTTADGVRTTRCPGCKGSTVERVLFETDDAIWTTEMKKDR